MSVQIQCDSLFHEGWLHATLGVSAQTKEAPYMAGYDMALDTHVCAQIGDLFRRMGDLSQIVVRVERLPE